MQPGNYSITVEVAGFKKLDRSNITLNGNEKLAIGNLQLQVGTIDQSVEVRAEALQLQTESGERSQTMNSKVMENIEELRGLDHPAVKAQGQSRADRES